VCLLFAGLYLGLAIVGPFQRSFMTHRNGADPILLNAFFLLYLAASGGGPWRVDRFRRSVRSAQESAWAPHALALLRVAAGLLFVMHGLEKFFGIGGGRIDRDVFGSIRGLAGLLETVGGPLIALGLFTRATAFILSGEMAVAYFRSWAPRGFWESFQQPGMEASILFCYLFLFLSAEGPGAWSLDWLRRGGRSRSAR
jgi:putative oxidoreductase